MVLSHTLLYFPQLTSNLLTCCLYVWNSSVCQMCKVLGSADKCNCNPGTLLSLLFRIIHLSLFLNIIYSTMNIEYFVIL